MSDDLTFHMGKFPALLPGDLRYCRNHMWCRPLEKHLRFGFTAYAVRLMQDVYFLDWSVDEGTVLEQKQEIGHIETSKAESDLFAPLAGTLLHFNRDLLKDPTPINVENYGAGWLFEMEGDINNAISPAEYYKFLDENWEKTQQLLKGHM
jgi:glycine cleavage system H protein